VIHAYDFDERRAWSEGFLDEGLAAILRSRMPGCLEIRKASQADDRNEAMAAAARFQHSGLGNTHADGMSGCNAQFRIPKKTAARSGR
jgi:hypothetical protein